MIHTKFQGHRVIAYGEDDFLSFFLIIYGHGGYVGHVTQLICIKFHSHSLLSFRMSFGSESLNCFYEKQVLTWKSE